MEKRNISIFVIILIIVLALVIGAGIGYFVYEKLNSSTDTINEIQESKQNIQNMENVKKEDVSNNIINYDGSKNITIDGENYKVSYISEKFKNSADNNLEDTEVKLYLNDKYIGTADLENILDVNHVYGNKDYDVELHKISEDYIAIILKTEYNNGENDPTSKRVFFIINTDGIHIDTLVWDNRMHISDINNKEFKYEIDNEGIILYELNGNSVDKIKYTLTRNIIRTQVLKTYNANEFSISGK